MTKLILTIFTSIIFTQAQAQFKLKGNFVGLELMNNYDDPANPNYRWYHLSRLTFNGDSVFLEQSPVAIYKKDTIFSASDGGFYSYRGVVTNFQGKTIATLTLIHCDYCPMRTVKFTAPKNIVDTANATNADTILNVNELEKIEPAASKYKTLVIEATEKENAILVDGNVYRRQENRRKRL